MSPASCLQIGCSARQTEKACLETKAVFSAVIIITVITVIEHKPHVAVIDLKVALTNPALALINAISLTPCIPMPGSSGLPILF